MLQSYNKPKAYVAAQGKCIERNSLFSSSASPVDTYLPGGPREVQNAHALDLLVPYWPCCAPSALRQHKTMATQTTGTSQSSAPKATNSLDVYCCDTCGVVRCVCLLSAGPSRQNINDFWRMVWQENVRCIAMATNVFEHARVSDVRVHASRQVSLCARACVCVSVCACVCVSISARQPVWGTSERLRLAVFSIAFLLTSASRLCSVAASQGLNRQRDQ